MIMTRWAIIVTLILAAGTLVAAVEAKKARNDAREIAAVCAVVQLYFDGIIDYDEAKLNKAFHPDAYVIGVNRDGEFERDAFQDWVVYTRGKAPDPTGRNNTIVSVDIAGRAASVKTDLHWPHVRYIDYLSLLKIDGQWKIVNKIWQSEKP